MINHVFMLANHVFVWHTKWPLCENTYNYNLVSIKAYPLTHINFMHLLYMISPRVDLLLNKFFYQTANIGQKPIGLIIFHVEFLRVSLFSVNFVCT